MAHALRLILVPLALLCLAPAAQADDLRKQASAGLRKAVEYFHKQVATEGGYLWRYSEDLARREGEAKATDTQVWVQPPGTPTVGLAYLSAFEATGEAYYLDAARDAALALVKGQLRSGGWDYRIEFDPNLRTRIAYRFDGGEKGANVSTLDDDNTQAAIRLLMRLDVALKRKDEKIHDAVVFALTALLEAQYPNGAWQQRFDRAPDADRFPVKVAGYPLSWSRTHPAKDYRTYYTFNDNTIGDMIDVMLMAARLYEDERYRKSAEKAGGFILLAQMPEPQPGWAQQYDADMYPSWARKFEPPAVTGGEGQKVMQSLLRLYRETGQKKYLEPLPRALAYYRRSLLPDGQLARFYELGTNQPLYFTKDYKLTYKDDDLPTHYRFKVGNRLAGIEREYERLKLMSSDELKKTVKNKQGEVSAGLVTKVKSILAALDARGRWVEDGRLRYHGADDPTRRVISSQTFARNVNTLASYLAESRP